MSFHISSTPSHPLLSPSALFLNQLHHSIRFISSFPVLCTTVHFSGYNALIFGFTLTPTLLLSLSSSPSTSHFPYIFSTSIFASQDAQGSAMTIYYTSGSTPIIPTQAWLQYPKIIACWTSPHIILCVPYISHISTLCFYDSTWGPGDEAHELEQSF